MSYSVKHICSIVNGVFLSNNTTNSIIDHLLLDSRQISFPKNALFFALVTPKNDGHLYVADAYGKGVRNFVVEHDQSHLEFPDANFILVKNSLEALQTLTRSHRSRFDLPCIVITGSNGKTTVKEWLFQLLYPDFEIIRSPKSYNSQIGVPLSIWPINSQHNLGIFEAGISMVGEMEKIATIIDGNIGILTNIGDAHNEGFDSREEKIKEKLLAFQNADVIIYNKDDEMLNAAVTDTYQDKKLLTWSIKQSADLQITSIKKFSNKSTKVKGIYRQDKPCSFTINFTDYASVENVIHCCTLMLHLDYSVSEIQKRIVKLQPVAMRLELKAGILDSVLINDSYNSDLTSLSIALGFLEQQGAKKNRVLILSDILQSGEKEETLYRVIAQMIVEKKIESFYGIGDAIHQLKQFLPTKFQALFYKTTNDFLLSFREESVKGCIVLVKGARRFNFEMIAERLSEKAHETRLEINMNALAHNLNVYKEKLDPATKLMVMVKASGYGIGSVELARLLDFHHVDYLAVAYTDEGVELRKAGIEIPILVLNPEEATFSKIFRYRLEPEIYSLKLLERLIASLPMGNDVVPIHLKLETGMHRLGFLKKEIPALISLVNAHKQLFVQTVFSHLAGADDDQLDAFSDEQFTLFNAAYDLIQKGLGYQPKRHLVNSAGIIRFPEKHMEMVRLGIGLYGLDSSNIIQDQLQNVHTLKATIAQIKNLKKGDTVGYGRNWKVKERQRVATVSIGYADGLLRRLGNGHYHCLVKGQLAPTIGNICMDMCMLDVSEIPDAQEGDEVIIFGDDLPITAFAASLGTITYEVLTLISERVKRVYFQE